VLRTYEHHYNTHRPHRTLGQAAPLRPLPQPTANGTNGVRRRDRLGGLLHGYRHCRMTCAEFRAPTGSFPGASRGRRSPAPGVVPGLPRAA
jgi:hypothetical protein